MKITFWSDFNCPNSYIGLNRLKKAIDETNVDVKWEMKPFELYPTLFDTATGSIITQNVIKYGLTPEIAGQKVDETEKIALKDGIQMNYHDIKLTSSRNAHRLVKYVQNRHGEVGIEVVFRIYEANFIENKIIADINVLVEIASDLGLDENEIRSMLEGDSYDFEVQIDEEDAIVMGVESIPLYFLDTSQEQLIIPGAFEKEDFRIAIKDLMNGEITSKSYI
ncbi:MAG: DsbA family protein [Methanobrevibacter sp.]|uniref:DsbA family oxidoreductase n=1 Tax=Methanobrevibacter sp. TaxID=66852 RepID=UPI0025FB1035|nr:DsbA family protein [Methanobrevibacter sp.]MBQ8016830.1 DsbA family protein [Methanobrevibacter sp.]